MITEAESRTKSQRRERILDGAFEVFLREGIMNASMESIAREAGVSRRTLYRYYESRDELAFTLELKIIDDYFQFDEKIKKHLKGTGAVKIRNYLRVSLKEIIRNSRSIRFTCEFDINFRGKYPEGPLPLQFVKILKARGGLLTDLLEEGIADGSVKKSLPPAVISQSVEQSLLGLAQRILFRGEHLEEESGITPEDMLKWQIQLLCDGLET